MKKKYSKYVLGTAQFGGPYGINLNKKLVKDIELKKIFTYSIKNKIKQLDTARNYGNCEKRLKYKNINNFDVISKIFIPRNSNQEPEAWTRCQVNKIMKNLNLTKIYCILIHNPSYFPNRSKYFYALKKLKKEGLIKNIGFSVYETNYLKNIIKNYDFDVVQIPYNVFDRRFEDENCIILLKKKGIKIYVRSIFLQGMLLLNYDEIPKKFKKHSHVWKLWCDWLKINKLSAMEVCLNFVNSNKKIDKIIIGVHNINQLKEILNYRRKKIQIPTFFSLKNNKILNPLNWKIL